ncbi:hypothetical protein ADUPG1_000418 [Aduncisulcus paluster]|uniref:Uncharacterized protein n=1 Tax=Aduncisulcus paluster TaxID=2918883 RepID=A0ABQ5K6Q0_9EUKA|nr:hypothetical protein ADUPG1_000418 [Aduncisulcus paluster]
MNVDTEYQCFFELQGLFTSQEQGSGDETFPALVACLSQCVEASKISLFIDEFMPAHKSLILQSISIFFELINKSVEHITIASGPRIDGHILSHNFYDRCVYFCSWILQNICMWSPACIFILKGLDSSDQAVSLPIVQRRVQANHVGLQSMLHILLKTAYSSISSVILGVMGNILGEGAYVFPIVEKLGLMGHLMMFTLSGRLHSLELEDCTFLLSNFARFYRDASKLTPIYQACFNICNRTFSGEFIRAAFNFSNPKFHDLHSISNCVWCLNYMATNLIDRHADLELVEVFMGKFSAPGFVTFIENILSVLVDTLKRMTDETVIFSPDVRVGQPLIDHNLWITIPLLADGILRSLVTMCAHEQIAPPMDIMKRLYTVVRDSLIDIDLLISLYTTSIPSFVTKSLSKSDPAFPVHTVGIQSWSTTKTSKGTPLGVLLKIEAVLFVIIDNLISGDDFTTNGTITRLFLMDTELLDIIVNHISTRLWEPSVSKLTYECLHFIESSFVTLAHCTPIYEKLWEESDGTSDGKPVYFINKAFEFMEKISIRGFWTQIGRLLTGISYLEAHSSDVESGILRFKSDISTEIRQIFRTTLSLISSMQSPIHSLGLEQLDAKHIQHDLVTLVLDEAGLSIEDLISLFPGVFVRDTFSEEANGLDD